MTVKELMTLCNRQIAKWNWNKKIFISSDDEWNDFHELLFWFTSEDIENQLERYRLEDIVINWGSIDDIILLG